MNSINNNKQSVNFGARMDLSRLNPAESKQLKNISKMFEDKTQKYPNDVFEIQKVKYPHDDDYSYNIAHHDKGFEHENSCDIPLKSWNELLNSSDVHAARKFVKLFNIFKKKDNELDRAGKYIVSVVKKDKNNDPTDFESKFWDIVIAKANSDMNLAVIKDSVLKNWEVY